MLAAGLGVNVIVTEIDHIRALETRMDDTVYENGRSHKIR